MSIPKIVFGLVAAFLAAASAVSVVWGVAVWLATMLPPVQMPFALAAILALTAALCIVVAKALRPSRALPMQVAGAVARPLSGGSPTPAEVEALASVCAQRPLTGLGASFVLGLVQGLDSPPRRR
ncbi:hypothetical protein BN1012_Phect1794 [Candidatus Phaeomarinobacter ectocarpi]|uniref:Uncharacterized protein n=1 Tax=Candidatus Phaeomarinibacter ectocarpi TaxID=1458461 RepID=X5M969_9HYPH|nr:hypothetical protein [Candidatus Phaeomarinobacter ectocarpi]CDO60008.1 hypothetical protein BN1012_Phect1794 [Candidatus Phaeomarinobacter ectocarpi]